jgi:2-isopropylmalate synthase
MNAIRLPSSLPLAAPPAARPAAAALRALKIPPPQFAEVCPTALSSRCGSMRPIASHSPRYWRKSCPNDLIIFDTTLRDGEQSPGASMTRDEKLRIARQLERMRVDVIEAGFAAASPGDFEAVRAVAESDPRIHRVFLARANENDIRRAGEAIRPAASGRIHTFIATSPIHMEKKLRMTPDQVVEQAVKAVAGPASTRTMWSSPPRTRCAPTSISWCRVFEAVIKAGAKTINVPDTVGYTCRRSWAERIRTLIERVPERRQGRLVDALPQRPRPGRRQFARGGDGRRAPGRMHDQRPGRARRQCRARGDRDGGAHAPDVFGCETRIDTTQIVPARSWCPTITGFPVQPNKAWSAPTPSRTSPASTRTACSSTARPTRSCAPRTWAGTRTSSCWASTRAATPSVRAS